MELDAFIIELGVFALEFTTIKLAAEYQLFIKKWIIFTLEDANKTVEGNWC